MGAVGNRENANTLSDPASRRAETNTSALGQEGTAVPETRLSPRGEANTETLPPETVSEGAEAPDPFGETHLPVAHFGSGTEVSAGDSAQRPRSSAGSLPREFGDPTTDDPREVDVAAVITQPRADARYAMVRRLGEGGMGTVELLRDGVVGRDVAVKRLRVDHMHRADMRLRFLREARIQGQLEHPAIVPVYDLSAAEDGAPFFTMKRVRGETLEEILELKRRRRAREGKNASASFGTIERPSRRIPSLRKLLTALAQAALAVEFAHARGVVHRDLKPANIMLGAWGEVYVLDWGIAKLRGDVPVSSIGDGPESLRGDRGDRSRGMGMPVDTGTEFPGFETAYGSITGTVGYLSPEQARGLPVDGRSDVWSLGTILFEILAGVPLIPASTPGKMLAETIAGPNPDPAERSGDDAIPFELVDLCKRALCTDVADRLPSARAFSEALERILDGDRDAQKRRSAALEEATKARKALENGDRDGAIAAAQAALALDGGSEDARTLLVETLLEPPAVVTAAMEEELDTAHQGDYVKLAKFGAIAYLGWLLAAPLFLYAGIRSWPLFGGYLLSTALASGYSFYLSRQKRIEAYQGVLLLTVIVVAIGVLAFLSGSLIIVPGIAAANSLVYASAAPARLRLRIVLLAALSVAIPLALEVTGLVPPAFRFEGGNIVLLPRLVEFSPRTLPVYFLFAGMQYWLTNFFGLRMRRDLEALERRMLAHTIELRRFVPEAAKSAARMPAPTSRELEMCALDLRRAK
jgi:serine/threonine-protein kinase